MKSRNLMLMAAFAAVATLSTVTAVPSFAQTTTVSAEVQDQVFFKKKYKIKGTWSIISRDGKNYVSFSDNFKTKNGPDLKVFLSPIAADAVNGKNASEGALNLGELQSNKGGQEYEIPEGTDLAQFSTMLIHCEAYSILWGGGSI